MFSDSEMRTLLLATIGYDDSGADEETIQASIDWCRELRHGEGVLRLILEGKLLFRVVDGEPMLKASQRGANASETASSESVAGGRRPPTP